MGIALPLLGGLALFLYGIGIMGEGLQRIAGDRMRKILEVLTGLPLVGVLVGAAVTSIIQSSSATTVMVVGFVNTGLMTLRQAISVIMGANIGTTITAQLIAFKLTDYVLPIIALGFGLYFISKNRQIKYLGYVILGFGILFLGLNTMSDAMFPLRSSQKFTDFILMFGTKPLLGLLTGVIITIMIQSSSATIGILMALSTQGLLPLETAIPILLGDNIGTCITAMLASIGTSLSAKRAALAHVCFNVVGAIIFLLFLPLFKNLVLAFSPPGDIARQIANAHTSFNVVNTLLFLPLIGFLETLVTSIIPGEETTVKRGPVFLDDRFLGSPSIALSLAMKEVTRMANFCRKNIQYSMEAFFENDLEPIKKVYEYEEIIDDLEKEVTFYMTKIAQHSMTPYLSDKHGGILHALNDLERIGDHAENIADLAKRKIEEKLVFSDQASQELNNLHIYVIETFDLVISALEKESKPLAREVRRREARIDIMEKKLRNRHMARLNAGLCYPASGVIFLDIISNFERIGDHSHNVAMLVLDNPFDNFENDDVILDDKDND
ncbi:MAG: Na/Pi cotransporter family protein [Clostridia bacterium]|nr:Na/Pi cotransporter family protein [Clostridia bacterium]